MRILHTIDSLDQKTGGTARSVPFLVESLRPYCDSVEVRTAGMSLRGLSPHIVHDHGLWLYSNFRSGQFVRQGGFLRVVSPRGMLEKWSLNYARRKKLLAWHLYQKASLDAAQALHVTSEMERRSCEALGFHRVVNIPNGVHLPEVPDRLQKSNTLLYIGRLHPKKGLDNLLQAWARLSPGDWQLTIAGPSEKGYREHLAELIASLGLGQRAKLLDELNDAEKWEHFQTAKVAILPSFSENFGITVAEALAAGTPVIATTGTPWSGLNDHRCGWWVEPTVEALQMAISEALSADGNALSEMGQRGRQWVAEAFSWESIGRQMARFYREAWLNFLNDTTER